MEENREVKPDERQERQGEPAAEQGTEKEKRPRNIVTDFYDSINVSVKQLDIALVVLCAFILLVIIFASKRGL